MARFSIYILGFFLILSACTKDESPEEVKETFVPSNTDSLLSSAAFVSDVHPTSGTATLYQTTDGFTLNFENFSSDNGPDLRVYLSADLGDADFVELGDLKAVSGSFSYNIDAQVDVEKYSNVLIWCQDFSVLFGHASLP